MLTSTLGVVALLLGLSLVTYCGGQPGPSTDATEGLQQVHGLVEEVQGPPFGLPEYLRVRDDSGQQWEFAVEGTVTFTTSHLQQHKTRLEKVSVHFRTTAEGLSAVDVTD